MKFLRIILITSLLLGLNISKASACACGCGIFNVGTSALIPNCAGGTAFLQYDYINQDRNWHNNSKAPSDDSHHKKLKTEVITAGMQYMFNRKWGMALRVPYVKRAGINSSHGHDDAETYTYPDQKTIGDVRINGIYSGFSADMSSGITFGLKLPTGDHRFSGFGHRDMQIGTGSTDMILGAYHFGKIDQKAKFNYFVQGSWQHAVVTRNYYRIGDEFAAATGVYYDAGSFIGIKRVAPILQFTGSQRLVDSGVNASVVNSGYTQIFFAPALEFNFGKFKTYADVEFPIYRNVNGNQLVADRIYKFILGYSF